MPLALQTAARLLPLSCAVSLLRGVWTGDGWAVHAADAPRCRNEVEAALNRRSKERDGSC